MNNEHMKTNVFATDEEEKIITKLTEKIEHKVYNTGSLFFQEGFYSIQEIEKRLESANALSLVFMKAMEKNDD